MLKAESVTFMRNDLPIFSEVSFCVEPGHVLQVTGPNGCGKTTLLKVLAGLLESSKGSVNWHNEKSFIYLGHKIAIKDSLTVKENILASELYGKWKTDADIDAVLARLNLEKIASRLCVQCSAGQRQRAALAKFLLLDAAVWILDEPFTAIDQMGRDLLSQFICEHIGKKGSVIFTSHQPLDFHVDQLIKLDSETECHSS